MKPLRILFVEDSAEDAELLALELEGTGYSIACRRRVQSAVELQAALSTEAWDLVMADYSMPAFSGLEALGIVRAFNPDLPFFLVSGSVGEELAVTAMRAGANDFLVRSNLSRLGPAVKREIHETKIREERMRAEAALRESEEHLRQAQRLESIGRLAGGIAHDFNNILSVVSGYANLLQIKLARSGMAHRELVEIEKAVIRATSLVKQLLTFSRRQVIQKQYMDLGSVLRDSIPLLTMMLGEDVTVEIQVQPDLDHVHADKGQMEQVILNLAVNAKDAMPKGGTLKIEISNCILEKGHYREGEKSAPGPYVRLSLSDNGIGMDEAIMSRIFEPFFTTKGDQYGTGLGLSTVYGIVRQSGGTIRVRSIPFAGTVFTLYLPGVPIPHSGSLESEEDLPRQAVNGESLLLVEDDVDLRKLTKDLLVMEGYKVLEARDVEEAMGFAQSRELPIHLMLTDLIMPRQNGRDLAETILALRPSLKVVFMSGYAPETVMPEGGWPKGRFLEKPFTSDKLLSRVRAALDAPPVEKQL